MKLFQSIRQNLSILGIDSIQSKYTRRKLVITLLNLSFITAANVLYLVLEANTFEEFANNIYTTSSCALTCINFSVTIFKQEELFDLMDDFEIFIDKSECSS